MAAPTWAETIRDLHENLGSTNLCMILVCGRPTEVTVLWVRTGERYHYCARCAHELAHEFPRLFAIVE
jgi:hypothetical protein